MRGLFGPSSHEDHVPIASMYGIFTYIWLTLVVNVGINIPYMGGKGIYWGWNRRFLLESISCQDVPGRPGTW